MCTPNINFNNDVNEGSCFKSIPVSSNRESYVPQVSPDRHQATARKLKDKLNIATWNIRTLLQKGKLENIKQEMERMKFDILGLSEVRWKGAGKITSGGHEIIYSGGTESEKGVGIIVEQTISKAIKGYWALSDRVLLVKIAGKPVDLNIIQVYAPTANSNDEDLDKFYNDLDTAKTQCKSQDPLITMGDFNAKQKGVGLTQPLVDAEGFPRADIDIYSCRHARSQVARLQNDHKAVMKEIEDELAYIHQQARERRSRNGPEDLAPSESSSSPVAMETDRLPFALVDRVDPGSPAAYGGLEVGDQLLEFGSVMSENFVNLQTLASIMQHSKGRPVRCVVMRGGRQVPLNVTPNTWSGPGLLGCNIKPMKK
ncbi:POU domain protein [Plakobranchus ocellatus]|uniref:26S proteasome non-ATPase regulatory subunit 9 n=1 Tax=Plakobranchus ocellatus TaxID=259542 RepID=A0AAV4CBP6_9GAST|nr:POU domain protein [Plakobranchus ocellatus]